MVSTLYVSFNERKHPQQTSSHGYVYVNMADFM